MPYILYKAISEFLILETINTKNNSSGNYVKDF